VTPGVVVGLDNGGTTNNATVLTLDGRFVIDEMVESPSKVTGGTVVAVAALVSAFDAVLAKASIQREAVRAVGLDTPGPAGRDGVICAAGSTNFSHPSWGRFDVRTALEAALGIPVVYTTTGMPLPFTPTTPTSVPGHHRRRRYR
jgi:glucokinase